MIIYKHKRKKKYFNRGTKQKYVKYFSNTKSTRSEATLPTVPTVNPYFILVLMAGFFIFIGATFMLRNNPVLPSIRFEFTLPTVRFDEIGTSIASIPSRIGKSMPRLQPPTFSKPESIKAPEIQTPKLSIPKIHMPKLGIQEKIGSVVTAITNGLLQTARFLNPMPYFRAFFDTIANISTTIARTIGNIITFVLEAISTFFTNLFSAIGRALSPLDPRPAFSTTKNFMKTQLTPVGTTLRETKPFVNLLGKAFIQSVRDIGSGFSTAFSVFGKLRS